MAATFNTFINSFNNKLDEPVRKHLKNVYGCLSLSTISAAVGAYVHMYTQLLQANLLTTFGFAFFSGLGLGPLLEIVINIDPSIVVTALVGTTLLFVSFSISALLAERGRWLYLGDFIVHSLDLFMDFIGVFRHLLVILTQKEISREQRKRKD
ncbi:hypothetical protein HZH66_015061 [Vespula vulgaris]|uniref:Bax inhibitor 1 n=1 Tax=Vespula vulgaris TaxID=7454 RepID=A0A834MM28_VESVU|nr:hypothetical protein HZH66_015061 [Vespula vulgaris]